MGIIKEPAPVKYFCGIITSFPIVIEPIHKALEKILGEVDLEAGPFTWNYTSYYSQEMGEGLQKYFFSFKELRSPAELSIIKIGTNRIEDETAIAFQKIARPANLDPGYISSAAMILASTKPYSHRIYIGGGIYAQVDYLFKEKGRIEFNPWVYPDYRTTEYLDFFSSMRKELIKKINVDKRRG